MKVTQKKITIRELIKDYKTSIEEDKVSAYGGKLDIRPAYQRGFRYNDEQQQEVMQTILKGFPLNIMYWAKTETGWEVLDGQQRTLSICEYCGLIGADGKPTGKYSIKVLKPGSHDEYEDKYFQNLSSEQQKAILNYELDIYLCEGRSDEKIGWFRVVNTYGERLNEQELRNASYTGSWLLSAKKYFSRERCDAIRIGENYLNGKNGGKKEALAQQYLETVLRWIVDKENREHPDKKQTIEGYMGEHQHDANADALYKYFENVIQWVKKLFPFYRKEMKGLPWGIFCNKFSSSTSHFNSDETEREVKRLMNDGDVSKKSGIYKYLLSGKTCEKELHIRTFNDNDKCTQYEKQGGKCAKCGKTFKIDDMEGDHITPWSEGGHTTIDNLQMLCKTCNRTKGNR